MLVQLFSTTGLFNQAIKFRRGLNIILGKYSGNKELTGINGIGKSSLVRLVDYALLSNTVESMFAGPKYDFMRVEKHNVILEFVTDRTYYIKRSFEKGSKVYFGESLEGLIEYSVKELKTVFTSKFFPLSTTDIVYDGDKFGTFMDFYIKDDLENQKRADPLNFSKATSGTIQKAIYNFFLLGIPNRNLLEYEKLYLQYQSEQHTVKGLETKIQLDFGKTIKELNTERIKLEERIKSLELRLSDFKFLETYKEVEANLLKITSQINIKLKEYNQFDKGLARVKESFRFHEELDVEKVRSIYNEVRANFGDSVSKSLNEIITFRKGLVENRQRFLVAKEKELQESINLVLKEISLLENSRSELYAKLDEKGALDSITNAFEQLTLEKSKQATQTEILKQIDDLQLSLSKNDVLISQVKSEILLDLNSAETTINDLRKLFLEILKNTVPEDIGEGFFELSKTTKPRKNELPFKIEIDIPKADALGYFRLKMIAYDLMVFLNSIRQNRNLPDFLVHDGVYHGISSSTKVKSLNYIYHQSLAYPNFQYIVSFNEDEIFVQEEIKGTIGDFDFKIDDVVIARFTDNRDDMIFGRTF